MSEKKPQNLQEAIRKGTSKSSTGWLAYRTLRNLVEAAGRVTSVTRGHDVYYKAGTRPLIARRQATNGTAGALALMSTALGVYELATRRSDNEDVTYGLHKAETSDLVTNVVAYAISMPFAVRELKTGTSLVRKHPTSLYGKTTTTVSLIGSTVMAARCSHELYKRRATWLPEVSITVSDWYYGAKYSLRRAFTGEQKVDINRLLADLRANSTHNLADGDRHNTRLQLTPSGVRLYTGKGYYRTLDWTADDEKS